MTARSGDPLIVGSGIAGLYVALRLHELGVRATIVTKSRLSESNTRYAQGGIAAAVGPDDSPHLHFEDTRDAGAGLVSIAAARRLARDAPRRIADLVRMGVPFDTIDGVVALGREAAHSRARVVHAGGDATGLSIEETLRQRVVEAGIEVRERSVLRELRRRGSAAGIEAVLSDPAGGSVERLSPRPIVLATGGAGGLYLNSSNPSITTGEGLAIAFRAGAMLADMEFVQFHPTVLRLAHAPPMLMTEALRGEGALLRTPDGERFMPRYHRDAELAPRDVVSRAIVWELERSHSGHVLLDATGIPRDRLYGRFPTICRFLVAHGLDPAVQEIPVVPMAHYTIGGVRTDLEGRTSIRGLSACGEVASTGVHGANRLASNSLLEGLVFGERVALALRRPHPGGPTHSGRELIVRWPGGATEAPATRGALAEIRRRLWTQVGIVRSGRDLRDAVDRFERLGAATEPARGELPGSVAHAALTAFLIARAALERTESRGAHYRVDFPEAQRAWRLHLGLRRAGAR
ncbi:MAG: L-aspartate oxidase [Thermoplasmata archaeon]